MREDKMEINNSQKFYTKMIFRYLYSVGLGDWWYQHEDRSDSHRKLYCLWAVISNAYIFLNICNELLANFRKDLTDVEKNDAIQFSFAHPLIFAKIASFFFNRKKIREVFGRLLEENRSVYSCGELEKESMKQIKRYSLAFIGVSYMTLVMSTIDGLRAHFKEGIPIRTEVTYYPSPSNSGVIVNILRFLVEFHWWYIVSVMVAIDSLAVASFVFVTFKFKLLQRYFKDMGLTVRRDQSNMTDEALADKFRRDFIVGVKLHENALWCAENVQKAFGWVYSVQVFETVALLVMCLVKLVTTNHNMIFLLANFAFMLCVIILNGSYMMPAGDVTYEASEVPTSIFLCGWELVRQTDLRFLVVVAIQRSQVPVIMKAFGIMTLSYSNFIAVLRFSYSFFAVLY
ncbi:olfactory receptor 17 isoform X4 [Bombyx mori]|uniref:Odorant receptor n=2 Tax=Bombyx mori TaxID=7091 RepID=A0A8R2DJT8_BOMMO|nr:olfactory receptor 17 isoform X1 [Bombyx mori]